MRALIMVAVALSALIGSAEAQPLRLRGDAFVDAEPSVGLLVLQGSDTELRWLDAEALVWTGTTELGGDGPGDALVVTVRARDPKGRGEVRLGRFVMATGAVRPLHVDGIAARVRSRWGTDVEVFGGAPVVPHFGVDAYDWVAGTRISHRVGDLVTGGISYYHQRDNGFLADEEVGLDAAATPTPWLDVAARMAYDLVHPGLADANLTAAARRGPYRFEVYGARRSPSRLLPATSLFAVLGDVPSQSLGAGVTWRAAPRLDLRGSGGLRMVDDEIGMEATARATLRLDDRGRGSLGLELRRDGVDPMSSWTGVRGLARVPVREGLVAATELELVIPDDAAGRGAMWPWGLVALAWRPVPLWEASAGFEARSSPQHRYAISGLLRLSRQWEAP
ncbi:MAG TPA: hypothetical protein VML75_00440 [Kofleriaceae bacterium]|nr:hypothetical protein [Kofleriaceae bacterium]